MTAPASPDRRARVARRVLSWTGALPAAVFFLVHGAINASALWGTAALARTAAFVQRVPGLGPLEIVVVLAPLAVHAAVGLWSVATGVPADAERRYPTSIRTAMRVSGVVAFAFLVGHLFEFRFREGGAHVEGDALAALLARDLSATAHGVPWRGALYVVAVACVAFHFSTGLWGFAIGEAPSLRRSARWIAVASGGVGLGLWLLFVGAVVFHATGAHPMTVAGAEAADAPGDRPCPP